MITHNRYLLNHCFNKILHLENAEIQEFDGTYADYNLALLQMKIEQQELAASDMEEIERNRKVVERLRNEATKFVNASRGRTLKARVSLLERLEARKTRPRLWRSNSRIFTCQKETLWKKRKKIC